MRGTAWSLSVKAGALPNIMRPLRRQLDGMAFKGPAADWFRDQLEGELSEVEALAARLQAISDYLLSAAYQLEAQMAAAEQAAREAQERG